MATIALVETKWWGHHPAFARTIARILVEAGHRVACAVPPNAEVYGERVLRLTTVAYSHVRGACDRFVQWSGRPDDEAVRWLQRALWVNARLAVERMRVRRWRPDLVFLPMCDEYLVGGLSGRTIDLLFPYRWSGLVIFPPSNPIVVRAAASARGCRGLHVLDELRAEEMARVAGVPCAVFPDFVDPPAPAGTTDPAASVLRQARGRTVVGLIGALDRRKGLFALLEAARRLPSDEFFFVIAGEGTGRPGKDGLSLFEDAVGLAALPNLLFWRGWLSEGAFRDLVAAIDIVYAAYKNFPHSSNMMTQAAASRSPVLVSEGGVLAHRARQYGIGVVVDPTSVSSVSAGIEEARARRWSPAAFDRYAADHSLDRLREVLRELVSEASR